MRLANIQALIAPLASPAPAALLLATEVYHILLQMEVWWLLAMFIAAVGVFGGVEASGAVAFYSATECWRRRQWGMMFFAVLAAMAYVAILIAGILWLPDEGASVVVAVLASIIPVSYVGVAIWQSLRRGEQMDEVQFNRQAELERQRRLTINARARLKKVSNLSSGQMDARPVANKHGNSGGDGWEMTSLGLSVYKLLDEDSGRSARSIARELECSPSSVTLWRSRWLDKTEQGG